jgi:hypothetical protein
MSAILIERGAKVPALDDPLSFELTWHAIVQDSVILSKRLMQESVPWEAYFLTEKEKYVTAVPTKLDMLLNAKAAFSAIERFNRAFAPSTERTSSLSRMGM